jgi:ABC transporter substrate binding protein (PQQ-dependent alcohol dehydrogenase system)
MQSRFLKTYGRMMTPLDYSVWSAVRAIGEGATRTRSVKFRNIRNYIQGEKFVLAAYKGQKLTFRKWNGQLRQPILLTAARALVSVSPQRQFLHQFSQMDTLGYDRPEVKCEM